MNLGRGFAGALLAGALFAVSDAGQAYAQDQGVPVLSPYRLEPIGQVLLPDITPPDPAERVVENGDVVLRGRIAYRAYAEPTESFQVVIAGQTVLVGPGDVLAESRVTGGALASLGAAARIFCFARRLPLSPSDPEARDRHRYWREVQPCLIDRDGDGRFDAALLAGARGQQDLALVRVAPASYELRRDVPIPGAELRIVYQGRPAIGRTFLALAIDIPSFDWRYVNSIRMRGPDGRMRGFPYDRPVYSDTYPHVVNFGAARIEVLSYDSEARRVRLRVLEGFARTDLEIVLAVDGRR